MADEHVTIEAPSVHDLLHLAYLPIVQLHEPKQTLAPDAARHLAAKMREIIGYLHSDHIYKGEVLRMLYSIFLLDLQNAQQRAIVHRQTSQRVEEIFIGFIRLLPASSWTSQAASRLLLKAEGSESEGISEGGLALKYSIAHYTRKLRMS